MVEWIETLSMVQLSRNLIRAWPTGSLSLSVNRYMSTVYESVRIRQRTERDRLQLSYAFTKIQGASNPLKGKWNLYFYFTWLGSTLKQKTRFFHEQILFLKTRPHFGRLPLSRKAKKEEK